MSDAKTAIQETAPTDPDRSLVLSSMHIDIVMGNIEILTQGFKSWMTENVDYTRDLYGRNQGKPALLDPGPFKMMNFFRVRPEHEVLMVEVTREPREELVKYVVAAKLVHHVTGHVLAEGVGSCCTDEKKYQYRWLTQSWLRNEHGFSDAEVEGLKTSWEPRSLEVAKSLYGSPEKAAEAFSWFLDVFATMFNLETDEALIEALGQLHETGDNSIFLRSVTASGALENLVDEGFEKLRPLYDYLIKVINANIEGDAEPLRQGL